jgi:hypothetical protein
LIYDRDIERRQSVRRDYVIAFGMVFHQHVHAEIDGGGLAVRGQQMAAAFAGLRPLRSPEKALKLAA